MLKVPLAEHNNMIKTIPSDRADEPLGIAILPWRSRRDRPIPYPVWSKNSSGALPGSTANSLWWRVLAASFCFPPWSLLASLDGVHLRRHIVIMGGRRSRSNRSIRCIGTLSASPLSSRILSNASHQPSGFPHICVFAQPRPKGHAARGIKPQENGPDRAVSRRASPGSDEARQSQRHKHDPEIYPGPITFGILGKHEEVE
jgi:hypothetical protein